MSVTIKETNDGRLMIIYSTTSRLQAVSIKVPKEEFLRACQEFADELALRTPSA